MNTVDAWNSFIDKVAQPVTYKEGCTYKTIFQGRICLCRLDHMVGPIIANITIFGHPRPLRGKLADLYSLQDNLRPTVVRGT